MKKIILLTLLSIISFSSFSQTAKELIEAGVELHDKGDYAGAIKKYDAAIALEPKNGEAMYERLLSLFSMKKLDECIAACKKMETDVPDDQHLRSMYIIYGSAEDDNGNVKEALKVYDKGLKKFPGFYFFYFNKGITYMRENKLDDAYENLQLSVKNNHIHASSYYRMSQVLSVTNKIPAILSTMMYLILEPDNKSRSKESLTSMLELMGSNVKQTGENNITITLDPGTLDKKKKNKADDFSSVELFLSLSAALDYDSANKNKSPFEKFESKFSSLIAILSETKEKNKGFFWENIVPFFIALKKEEHLNTACHIAFTPQNDDRNMTWLKVNSNKIGAFYKWVEEFKWPE